MIFHFEPFNALSSVAGGCLPVCWNDLLEGLEKEMSGGSFDYACYRTMQFADELRNKLQEQGKDPRGEGGLTRERALLRVRVD